MTRARLLLGACSIAAAAFVAAGAVGASAPQMPMARYVEPANSDRVLRVAGLFGESDEEKAARLEHEQNQDDAIKALNQKVQDLEDSVRTLTGQNEELSHRVTELSDKIDRQQKDFEYRLCALAAQQLGSTAGQGDPNAVPCPGSGGAATSYNVTPAPATQGAPPGETARQLAPPPGVLGTLPAGSSGTSAAPQASGADTHAQYAAAMSLLAKARYDEASAAFRSFADTYPKDDLTPQALFWVADIAYVQKDYDSAARGFAEVIKKYPTSTRAADSMLKLGQTLIAAGQKKEGCTALAALPEKYPKADPKVLAQGATQRKAVCKGLV